MLIDPFTLAIAIKAVAAFIVAAVIVLSLANIVEWFQSRSKIKVDNRDAIAFTLAERLNNKQYGLVTGIFDGTPRNSQLVQGFYDVRANKIIEARKISTSEPVDEEVTRLHDDVGGLVLYT